MSTPRSPQLRTAGPQFVFIPVSPQTERSFLPWDSMDASSFGITEGCVCIRFPDSLGTTCPGKRAGWGGSHGAAPAKCSPARAPHLYASFLAEGEADAGAGTTVLHIAAEGWIFEPKKSSFRSHYASLWRRSRPCKRAEAKADSVVSTREDLCLFLKKTTNKPLL